MIVQVTGPSEKANEMMNTTSATSVTRPVIELAPDAEAPICWKA